MVGVHHSHKADSARVLGFVDVPSVDREGIVSPSLVTEEQLDRSSKVFR